jgi:putative ABC transport system substrate-binding protein
MKRRAFISLLGAAAAWPLAARAQQTGNRASIGLLWPAAAPPASPRMESFRLGLRESGFVEGQNVVIAIRHPQSGPQQLPELAAELVRMKVDVILSNGDFAPRVARTGIGSGPASDPLSGEADMDGQANRLDRSKMTDSALQDALPKPTVPLQSAAGWLE